MITIVCGRTASGKDTFVEELVKRGMTRVRSYTTRPKRSPDEDNHIFITKEEADAIQDKVAYTVYNGYEYFTTMEQLRSSDLYIVEPSGVFNILDMAKNDHVWIVYVSASYDARRARFIARESDTENAEALFEARDEEENALFAPIEEMLEEDFSSYGIRCSVFQFDNTVDNSINVALAADEFQRSLRNVSAFRNAANIIREFADTTADLSDEIREYRLAMTMYIAGEICGSEQTKNTMDCFAALIERQPANADEGEEK